MQLSSKGPGGDDAAGRGPSDAGRGPGEFIEEFARSTPVLARTDVLVVGAGPAGTMAAIAAAEAGARVVLIDRNTRPGLLAGDALVAWIGPPKSDATDATQVIDRITALLAQVPPQDLREDAGSLLANPHRLRVIALSRLRHSGVAVAFGAQAVAPLLHDDSMRGALCEQAGQRFALRAEVTIDATGHAPTFARAGGAFDAASLAPAPPSAAGACLVGPVDADRWQAAVTGPADAPGRSRLARLLQVCGDAGLPYAAWAADLMVFEPPRASGDPAEDRLAFFREHAPGFEQARLLAIGASPFARAGPANARRPGADAADDYRSDADDLCALPPPADGQPARRLRRDELLSADHRGLLIPARLPERALAARWRIGEATGLLAALAAVTRTAPHRVPTEAVRRQLGQAIGGPLSGR
ncbi:MAG TPA: FAD-dependent oxidoreductase [Burkholderiaceae bacterium]|nr:FAD-dependent oxidoreductase [Burkholderiaceae bacterium]